MVTSEALERLRRALELPDQGRRRAQARLRRGDGVNRLAQRRARGEVEGERHGGEDALVVDGQRLDRARHVRDRGEGDLPARRVRDVDARQRLGPGLKLPLDLEDQIRLLGRQIDIRDLRLPEGVLERRVDARDRHIEA